MKTVMSANNAMNMDISYRHSIFTLLPEELHRHIWDYVVDQRKNYGDVMNEMTAQWMTDVCDNDMCREYINCNTAVEGEIDGVSHSYCSNYCEKYDTWSHKYNYNKWNHRAM